MQALNWLIARPVAHRGLHDANAGIIENTTSAFAAAIAANYAFECDLQISGDGEAVVHHDDQLGRLTEGVGRLDAMTTAELKRMYVEASSRRHGIGRALVEALEREARLLGVTKVVLETGTRLRAAIQLYEGMGYTRIPLFAEYVSSPNTSVCFGKSIAGNQEE